MQRILVLALISLSGCSSPMSNLGNPQQNTDLAAGVIHWVNVEREKEGLSPLSHNAALASVAYAHSADMLEHNFFDHINLAGDGPVERIEEAGINYTAVGENVGKGFITAQEAVVAWMGSPPHRANIMESGFTQIGVGVAISKDDPQLTLWTQVFRTP
ncbi:MAG TPA: CAP domain-containing protein [Myxococcales bacterium]|nr:CAP domain-containing protein [Myxococcales bacterium]HIN86491.1 CAP domain-containing protein [Myxococcales bacterium]